MKYSSSSIVWYVLCRLRRCRLRFNETCRLLMMATHLTYYKIVFTRYTWNMLYGSWASHSQIYRLGDLLGGSVSGGSGGGDLASGGFSDSSQTSICDRACSKARVPEGIFFKVAIAPARSDDDCSTPSAKIRWLHSSIASVACHRSELDSGTSRASPIALCRASAVPARAA